ncbi:MAG: PSD1 and planctomycete cytochrome C domain-containing protein [Planctomycetota bacterium]|nr:PSD1 and planctomycete cytochrome C domain-containing protein [Planctomycetota bacterium]
MAEESGAAELSADPETDKAPHFEADIHPLLAERCGHCHGSDGEREAGLDVHTLTSLLRGGSNGPAIVPGNAEQSILVDMISHGDMPPDDEEKLSADQVDLIRRWILAGAPADEQAVEEEPEAQDAAEPHWAFQPLQRPPLPVMGHRTVGDTAQNRVSKMPIDAFLEQRLERVGLSMAPESDRYRLMRRVQYDLSGLPPTPEALLEFAQDGTEESYVRLVDRLLAAPDFGVRWGRFWLDLVGYVDTVSFDSSLDTPEGFVDGKWRYRDYVVHAFNQDKPFDVMLRQQLAGDEMVDWRKAASYTPETIEHLTATGYLRCVEDLTGEDRNSNTIWSVMHDNMTQLGTSLFGLSLTCARCHSHKFEPISQQDYYRLMAFLTPSLNPASWKGPRERALADISLAEREQADRWNSELDEKINQHLEEIAAIRQPYLLPIQIERAAKLKNNEREMVVAALQLEKEQRTETQKKVIARHTVLLTIPDAEVDATLPTAQLTAITEQQQKIDAINQQRRKYGYIHALYDVGPPPPTRFLQGGAFESPRREVAPGFLKVLNRSVDGQSLQTPPVPAETSGRRTQLASWLTDRSSPAAALVARVMVNRVWERLLGQGIVNPSENFGVSGARPTHPELLEWLTADFVDHGWSLKRLIRQIMLSAAYRQTSQPGNEVTALQGAAVDPENQLLWHARLRRLEGEPLRDTILALGDTLNLRLDGEPTPLEDQGGGMVDASFKGLTSPGDRYRRSLYLLNRRIFTTTFLTTFDKPVVTGCVVRRDDGAVSLQSLAMMNDPLVLDQSLEFAQRVQRVVDGTSTDQIQYAFLAALSRPPAEGDLVRCQAAWERHAKQYRSEPGITAEAIEINALTGICHALLGTSEFLYLE